MSYDMTRVFSPWSVGKEPALWHNSTIPSIFVQALWWSPHPDHFTHICSRTSHSLFFSRERTRLYFSSSVSWSKTLSVDKNTLNFRKKNLVSDMCDWNLILFQPKSWGFNLWVMLLVPSFVKPKNQSTKNPGYHGSGNSNGDQVVLTVILMTDADIE